MPEEPRPLPAIEAVTPDGTDADDFLLEFCIEMVTFPLPPTIERQVLRDAGKPRVKLSCDRPSCRSRQRVAGPKVTSREHLVHVLSNRQRIPHEFTAMHEHGQFTIWRDAVDLCAGLGTPLVDPMLEKHSSRFLESQPSRQRSSRRIAVPSKKNQGIGHLALVRQRVARLNPRGSAPCTPRRPAAAQIGLEIPLRAGELLPKQVVCCRYDVMASRTGSAEQSMNVQPWRSALVGINTSRADGAAGMNRFPNVNFESLPDDPRRKVAPATQRNRDPILEVLRRIFPASGAVIEIASGSGEHAVYFADAFPDLVWQPSDVESENLQSIQAWTTATGVTNVLPPLALDLGAAPRPSTSPSRYAAGFCANLIHIAPWAVCAHLFQFMGQHLVEGAPLVLYGPYKVDGAHTSESNAQFEKWLQSLSPEYGVRDRSAVIAEAAVHGLDFDTAIAMPANNFCLVFHKRRA